MTGLLVLHIAKRAIQAVSLDGSRVRTVLADVDETPDGIVVDQARGHIYWTNMGTPDPTTSVSCAPAASGRALNASRPE
jgi:hypothetical protein